MFRIFTLIVILGSLFLFFYALRSRMDKLTGLLRALISGSIDSFKKLRTLRSLKPVDIINYLKTLVYLLAVICVLVLAVTGFAPYLLSGKSPTGFILMLHVSAAPVFAVCLTLLVLLTAHRHVFNMSDQFPEGDKKEKEDIHKNKTYEKLCFWLIVLLTVMVMGSIVMSMYPVFGTNGQEFLLNLHLISSGLFFAAVIFHTYLLINSFVTEPKNE
ncbi:cytochrome b/b6 domain-containing protein [candidate division KSB1 bacterium]